MRLWAVMVIMVIVAGILCIENLRRRAEFFQSCANHCDGLEGQYENRIIWSEINANPPVYDENKRVEFSKKLHCNQDYYSNLKKKYAYYASHPWLSVPADLPGPDAPPPCPVDE